MYLIKTFVRAAILFMVIMFGASIFPETTAGLVFGGLFLLIAMYIVVIYVDFTKK